MAPLLQEREVINQASQTSLQDQGQAETPLTDLRLQKIFDSTIQEKPLKPKERGYLRDHVLEASTTPLIFNSAVASSE